MTSALSTPLIGGSAQLDDGRESHDSVSPSRERSVLPPDAKAARRELFRPPSWLMVCGVVLLLMSVSLTAWYGTQNRPEMFDALCASLLTMVGVVPGFASVLFVDRPVLLLDRGRVAIRGWITPLLVGYGLIWLSALVSALACASTTDPRAVYVRVAICCSLLATLLTPLIFAAVLRRLTPHASTQAVVARAIGRHGTAMLAKNLRDVAVREFDAGDRPACEERLWGLATIAALSDRTEVRDSAVDELAFVVEHELLHDRDLALVGLGHLRALSVRLPDVRRKLAVHLVDIGSAVITREDVSGQVTKVAHAYLDEFSDQADASLLSRLVEQAQAAPLRRLRSHLDLIVRFGARAPRKDQELAAQRALKQVARFDSIPVRARYRLILLELLYGDSAGGKKRASIRDEAMLLAPDLLAGADRTNPTAPLARTEVRRSFRRGNSALYLMLADCVLDAEIDVPSGAVDPRGALLGEYLLAAVRAQDPVALRGLVKWFDRLKGRHIARVAPGAMVALRSVRDELRQQAGSATAVHDQSGRLTIQILDDWCWGTVGYGIRTGRLDLAGLALTTWTGASEKVALTPTSQRNHLIADVATSAANATEVDATFTARLHPALVDAVAPAELPRLLTILYPDLDATALSSEEVRTLLFTLGQGPARRTSSDPEDSTGVPELRDWLSAWLTGSPVDKVYEACEDWVASPRRDLIELERHFTRWAAVTHPGPALLLGLKARESGRDRAGALTDETWEWLHQDAEGLLERARAASGADENPYLTECANTWFQLMISGLVDGRTLPDPEVLARPVSSGLVSYQTITSALRFGAIRALPVSVRAALAPALVEAHHPYESLRLHRGVLRERQLAREALKQIEELVRTDDRPARATDRAMREVRSYNPGNLVRYVGLSSVRSLLATCLEMAVHTEQQELALELLNEAEHAAKEARPAARRIQSGTSVPASHARSRGRS